MKDDQIIDNDIEKTLNLLSNKQYYITNDI